MASSSWRGVADALPEALRLAEGARELLARELPPALAGGNPALRVLEGLRAATLTGRLWIGPKDEAMGLAVWESGVPAGRRVFLYLDRDYRTPRALGLLLDRLGAETGEGPVIMVSDPVPGFSPEEVDGVLGPRGFERLLRVDMVDPGGPLPAAPEVPRLRPLEPVGDREPLAQLLVEGYRDNPGDQALFRHHTDPLEDARYAVTQLFEGGVGTLWPDASFVVPDAEGGLLAATVVTDLGGPLLAEVVVAPQGRRRGYARRLVRESTARVRLRSTVPLRLVVTLRNRRAYELYRSLGWRRLEETLGGPWVHPGALRLAGLEPPFDGPA